MDCRRTLTLDRTAKDVTARIQRYMLAQGYTSTGAAGKRLGFERGSVLWTPFSFTPRGWKVTACADLDERESEVEIDIRYDVCTLGQIVTPKEAAFWESELDGLEKALQGERHEDPVLAADEAKNQNYRIVAAVLGVLFGIPIAAVTCVLVLKLLKH